MSTSPKRGLSGSTKARSFRDRKPNSPSSKTRSTYSPRSPLRWTPQRKIHDCISYNSRSRDLKTSPERSKEKCRESDLSEKRSVKDHPLHSSNKSLDLDGNMEWRAQEVGKKDRDIDSTTYTCSPCNSRERNLDSDLGVKKTEKDVSAYINSAYGSLEWKKSEDKKMASFLIDNDNILTAHSDVMSEKSKVTDSSDVDFITSSRKVS